MTTPAFAFEFNERFTFREAAVRLHTALTARGYPDIPSTAALCDSLCEWFEMQDFQLAKALTSPTTPSDWHLIRIGTAGEPITHGIDVLTLAPSLARAFAGLQHEMDQARVFAHAVIRTNDAICLHAQDGGLIASIEALPVQPTDLQKRNLVNGLMEGLRIHRDRVHFVKRLSTLHGLQELQDDQPQSKEDDPIGAMALATVKNQCIAMRRMLSELHGIDAEPSDAQALVAVTFGAEEWERYSARCDTAPESLIPAAIVHWTRNEPVTQARVLLYRTVAEAVFAFAQFCDQATPPLFPVFSGVNRTGNCYGPWLRADESPPEQDGKRRTESHHQCLHLSLLNCDVTAQMRTLLSDADATHWADAFFVIEGSTRDRLRASNRRLGIASHQQLFLGNWLFTCGSYDETPESRYLTIEKFSGETRLLSETVKLHKSVCVREANGQWCIVTEEGTRDVVVLDNLTEWEIRRMAANFAMACASRSTRGAPEYE